MIRKTALNLLLSLVMIALYRADAKEVHVWLHEEITVNISVDAVDILSTRILDNEYILAN